MSKTSVTMYSKANDTHASNITAKECWANKKLENLFIHSFVGTSTGGVSYVNSKTRATNDQQGPIVNTGVVSDIGIDGAGLLAVSDSPTGVVKYTRRGDFRQDDLGYWKNGSDQLLKAWKLDGQGNRPQNSSLLSSLEAVNFANTKGLPVKTSVISIAMNLNADQKALRGPGPQGGFVMQRSGNNKSTKAEEILLPDQVGTRALRLGDEFTFRSSAGQANKTVTYGGLTVGNKASNTNRVYGAASASTTFTFGAAPAPGVLVDGQQFRIAVSGGATYTFTAMSGQASGTNFNSIQTLANAINKISVLQARVVDDRLYIAPKDANKGLTYQNVGGGTNIVQELGLRDLAQANAGVGEVRFNSLRTLRDAVNTNQSIDSLLATIEPGNNIKITSLLSTSSFTVASNQIDGNKIFNATMNPGDSIVDRATVFIDARDHGLNTGDLVRINDFGGGLVTNGVYRVSGTNDNGFTINIATGAGVAAYNQAQANIVPNPGATWQIASGQKNNNPLTAGNITGTNAGGNAITVTAAADVNRAVGDIIYIDGGTFYVNGDNVTLPSGYYEITGVGGGNTTFTFNIQDVTTAPANPGYAGAELSFVKVGTNASDPFETPIFGTTNGSTAVTYNVGSNSHNYVVGGTIRFTGLAGVINGITIDPNFDYTITNIADGVITFDVADDGAAGVGNATGAIQLSAHPNARINNHSRLFEYFGLDSEKDAGNPNNANVNYDRTYNPEDIDKNITNGNFESSEVFSHPVTVYNSQGSTTTLILYFAKLEDNRWAVELATQRDDNGNFSVSNDLTNRSGGVIQYGEISFNEDGSLAEGNIVGFGDEVTFTWGQEQMAIKIDFPNDLSEIKTGNVSQVKNPNNVEIAQSDGQAAGTLLKLEVDPQGFIIGTFDSGETRKLYQVPIAIFANVNGLVAGANGTFEISRESGELLLKQAGVGGAGRTLGGVLEASNVDTTEQLLKVQELSNTIRANARAVATEFKNISTVLNELNQ